MENKWIDEPEDERIKREQEIRDQNERENYCCPNCQAMFEMECVCDYNDYDDEEPQF